MRAALFFCVFLGAAIGFGQSHPSWWTYAPPEATALVGIHWEALRETPLAPAVEAELADLDCLKHSRQLLLASPEFLAIAWGDFPPATVRAEAAAKGLKHIYYKGIELWVASSADAMSIAPLNAQLVLTGARRTLEAAIDRIPTEKTGPESGRQYSPLLAKAARFAQQDLWVVAAALPDPLASRFVPFDAEASGFAGGLSVGRGLTLEATLDAGSEQAAAKLATRLRGSIDSLPSMARSIQIATDSRSVVFALEVSPEQLQSSLRPEPEPAPSPAPAPVVQTAPQTAVVAVNGTAIVVEPAPPVHPPAPPMMVAATVLPPMPQQPPKPPPRQVIRIFGLDEGIREIELPPVGSR